MAETKSTKQYGLFVPKKKSVLQVRPSIFNDDENDEDDAKSIGVKLQKEGVKAVTKKTTQLEMQKALMEDPTVYDYDSVYDAMEMKKQQKQMSVSKDRKPKYIESLLKTAEMRKREYERRIERKVQKEREAEGDEFNDKEAFVTSAYRKKMEEFQKLEEEEKREEMFEELTDVTKQKDLSGFYRHLLRQKCDGNKTEASSSATVAEQQTNSSTRASTEVSNVKEEMLEKDAAVESSKESAPAIVKPKIKEDSTSSSENESAEFNKTNPKTQRNIRKRRSSSSSSDDSRQDRQSRDRRKKSHSSEEDDRHKQSSSGRRNRRESPVNNRSAYSRTSKPDYQRRRYFEKSPEKYRNYRSSRERYSPRSAPVRNRPRRYSRSSSRSSEGDFSRRSKRDDRIRQHRNSSSAERGRYDSRHSASRNSKTGSKRQHSPEPSRRQPSNPVNVTQNYDKSSNEDDSADENKNKVQKLENSSRKDRSKEKRQTNASDDKKIKEKITEGMKSQIDTDPKNFPTNNSKDTANSPSQVVNILKLFAKRNVGDAVIAARERYLARQRAKLLEATAENKET